MYITYMYVNMYIYIYTYMYVSNTKIQNVLKAELY